jgi:hypothetical protein
MLSSQNMLVFDEPSTPETPTAIMKNPIAKKTIIIQSTVYYSIKSHLVMEATKGKG